MLRKFGSQLVIAEVSTTLEDLVTEKPPVKILEPKRADFIYFRARAISAGDQGPEKGQPNPNGNGDYFPRKELESSYQTFVGRNLFLNHESDHPVKSIGKIVDAYAVEDPETGEFYIECLSKIDRKLHPEIARKVETGELDKVSMGCSCEESMCSVCGLTIHSDDDQKCDHLSPHGLLKDFAAEVDMPEYGIQQGQKTKAFAINKGLTFNELSIVNVPADASAVIKTIIASNIKEKLTKKASLDKEEQQHLLTILSSLDKETQEQVKAEFCGCPVPKEDKKMSETPKSNDLTPTAAAVDPEEAATKEILSKLNGYDYHRLLNQLEKKQKKAEKAEVPAVVVTEAKEEKKEEMKKEDKKEEEKMDEKEATLLEKLKNSIAYKLLLQTIKREASAEKLVEATKVEEPKKEAAVVVRAEFKKADDLSASTWTLLEGDKALLSASLKDLWTEAELKDEAHVKWATSNEYADALVARYNKDGIEAIATLMGVAYKATDVKDSKVETPAKSEFVKPGTESKADKEADKSAKALEKVDQTEVGTHLVSSEPDQKKEANKMSDKAEAFISKEIEHLIKDKGYSQDRAEAAAYAAAKEKGYDVPSKVASTEPKVEKKADDEMPVAPVEEEVKVEEPMPNDQPMSEAEPEVPAEDTDGSAFDKLHDKIILGEGFEASKDPESGLICVYDANGAKVKELPDGFGSDVPTVMKLLQEIMGIKPEEKKDETPMAEPKLEEKPEEPKKEEPKEDHPKDDMTASQDAELEKKAAELAKKEAELKEKEASIAAKHFGSQINSRMERCKAIVESMVERDMIEIDDADVEAAIANEKTMIEARQEGLAKAVSRQVSDLMTMDENSLKAFVDSVKRVKKVAKKNLVKPLHIAYEEQDTEDKELNQIFNNMGTLKGK